ncbi:MAG: hypothetical protein KDD37_10200 [Bdellovibrionales bacterium]|nr:hypothetical protein [Bdellovibrionales bacterium]
MSFTDAKNKVSNLNTSNVIGGTRILSKQHDHLAPSFQEDLEPLLRLKKNVKDLEQLNSRMNFMMRELQSLIK